MAKKNMWMIGGLVVIIAAGIIFAVAHKSNKNSPGSSYTPASTSSTPPKTTTSASIITTKTDPTAGEFLADGNGKPLYTYGADTAGVSNCTGSCLANWPLYGPTSSSASLPTNVTIITRSDGKAQYAYKGLPLYYFSGDSGSTPTGDGADNFHLAKP